MYINTVLGVAFEGLLLGATDFFNHNNIVYNTHQAFATHMDTAKLDTTASKYPKSGRG
jgi:hypothetical protein